MNPKQLKDLGLELFGGRMQLLSLWQEISEHFYPERADFTVRREIGTDFAGNLTTSYPLLVRRDLGDQFGAMLRPTQKEWFHTTTVDDEYLDHDAKRWLERATRTQRRAMYDPMTGFTRASKEGDHDFAAFGQAVLSIEMDIENAALVYRSWHLRDVVWQEDTRGRIGYLSRRWMPTALELSRRFKGKINEKVTKLLEKKPFERVEVHHMVCDADMVDATPHGKQPRFSIYYDVAHDHLMEIVPIWGRIYRVPRWQTVSGSQYAFSPATVAALPEARLLQAMAYTLLEAGEKIVNPPMIGTSDAVRSDVALYAGGMTWVDKEYDERLGEALRPLTTDAKGMPLSRDMQGDARAVLQQCFYLNKLSLPQTSGDMTAYEVGQRIQEYIRGALPLFEPMEMDYNGAVCEETFLTLQRAGAFGSIMDMPKALQGRPVSFRFESPLHDAIERQKGQRWLEAKQLIADAVSIDQTAIALLDAKVALRDALNGIGTPAEWIRTEVQVQDIEQAQAAAAQAQATLAAMQQGSEVAANLGAAAKDSGMQLAPEQMAA